MIGTKWAQGVYVARNRANVIVGAAVAAVLVVAVVAFALMQAGGASDGAQLTAVVHDGDGGVRELALSADAEVTVTTSLGTNVVVVEGGAVFVREADCDNQDCVHQGKLEGPGHQIICLPHKLWIEVVAEGQQGGSMDTGAVAGDGASEGSLDAVAR